MNLAYLFNHIWIQSQKAEYKRFLKACKNPEATQAAKLKAYVERGIGTEFGRTHGFPRINNYQDFANQVPVQSWADIQPWIEKMVNGEENILTSEPLLAFEETSGTTSMAKLIPYTQSLRDEFQTGVAAWICSLSRFHPKTFTGPSYWSVSPATREKRSTPNGIPIGLQSDGEYFNLITRFMLSQIWAVSPTIARETNPEKFYIKTLKELLLKEDLSMISVWSPGFFIQLDHFLQEHRDELIEWLVQTKNGSKKRRKFLLDQLGGDFRWSYLFPRLSLVSCWTHAQAKLSLPLLHERLGFIYIQPKGLLSTEAITSIPVHPQLDPAISLRSHFYEFRVPNQEKTVLAHQVKPGETYEVIVTTGGGLFRYATGDLVKITGFFHANPCLEFLGRGNSHSDLVGEKLNEPQLVAALSQIPEAIRSRISTMFVSPFSMQAVHQYRLCISFKEDQYSESELQTIQQTVEGKLIENPYYAQAIRLKQLNPLEVKPWSEEKTRELEQFLKKRNQIKDGDFKMPVLILAEILEEFGSE